MQTINKKLQKIVTVLDNLSSFPKAIIKHGVRISLALFAAGGLVILVNHFTGYDAYKEFIGTSIIKNSITVLAEVIIGGLLIDFIFKKN